MNSRERPPLSKSVRDHRSPVYGVELRRIGDDDQARKYFLQHIQYVLHEGLTGNHEECFILPHTPIFSAGKNNSRHELNLQDLIRGVNREVSVGLEFYSI